MTTAGIAVFVKTPGYSPVKSRLAADCGEAYARDWYRLAAASVAAVIQAAAPRLGLHAHWAVAEAQAIEAGAWQGLDVLSQGEGGLGERMASVHAQLVARHGRGLLVGADTPQLSVELLAQALAAIQGPAPELVLGPARDGGFWLFGGNLAPPVPAWSRVTYSAAHTAREFEASMAGYGLCRRLPELVDVDQRADLRVVLEALQRLPEPLPEQRALATWMSERPEVLA